MIAGSPQNLIDITADRAFSVGSGHMNDLQFLLRVTQLRHQCVHPLQPQNHTESQVFMNPIYCLHFPAFFSTFASCWLTFSSISS